ncbi:unnamed protein product [Triticum turgidum subsp. durum]|uniref:Uncharacterized protein n=1 Tax=Triticum turgidum subsp. durum TaxID=4567 RepID=A0A9R1R0B1_TRITD|nr:unnamed protein product [Triticum turgidum subsp. durum]
MNMALFVWIVAVGISGAILFMVMTGMLNAVLRTKSQKDTWFEVNNQILNALFTLMCLYNHPRRFYHLALLCRWRAGDMAALREVYCKGGIVKPNERRHMMVVVLLLHLNCLAQYALCGLNLGLSRNRRPPVGVGLTVTVAICAPAVASMYNNLSPLGKDYEVQAADDEEQESSSSGSRQRLQHKTVERRYSFSPSPPQRQGLEMGAAGAVWRRLSGRAGWCGTCGRTSRWRTCRCSAAAACSGGTPGVWGSAMRTCTRRLSSCCAWRPSSSSPWRPSTSTTRRPGSRSASAAPCCAS